MHRTTVMLDEELYRAVKRKAIDRGRPMRLLVEEALRTYLGLVVKRPKAQQPRFGVYRARVRGSLSRQAIYDEYLERKAR